MFVRKSHVRSHKLQETNFSLTQFCAESEVAVGVWARNICCACLSLRAFSLMFPDFLSDNFGAGVSGDTHPRIQGRVRKRPPCMSLLRVAVLILLEIGRSPRLTT